MTGGLKGREYQTSAQLDISIVKPKINTALKLLLLKPQSILAFTHCYWRQMNYSEFLKPLNLHLCRNRGHRIGHNAATACSDLSCYYIILYIYIYIILQLLITDVDQLYKWKTEIASQEAVSNCLITVFDSMQKTIQLKFPNSSALVNHT